MHSESSFITLTYSDEAVPDGHSLQPKHLQDWLKRFRKAIEPLRVRYYAVGEYGDESQRPHYHVAMFGYPSCRYGVSTYNRYRNKCCDRCDLVSQTWGHGHVLLGQLEQASAQYIVGYVTKKMTSSSDDRLNGRYPEFARMSRRPGIGVGALDAIFDSITKFNLDFTETDVPVSLRHGNKLLPLGRFLRRKLRLMLGGDGNAPPEAVAEAQKEVRAVFEAAWLDQTYDARARLYQAGAQKVLNLETRQKLQRKKSL